MCMYIIYTYIYIQHLYLLLLLFSSFSKLTNLFVENIIETDIMGGNFVEVFFTPPIPTHNSECKNSYAPLGLSFYIVSWVRVQS